MNELVQVEILLSWSGRALGHTWLLMSMEALNGRALWSQPVFGTMLAVS